MLRNVRTAVAAMFAVAVAASSLACGGGQIEEPQEQTVITSKSGAKVTSSISAVSLGDSSANLQLAFVAESASSSAVVEVVDVTLVDASTGDVVETLKASGPEVWNGSRYTSWNERVTPGGDLKASYRLTTPAWSKLDPAGTSGRTAYSRTFKLRVTLRIDGVDVLMQSTDLHREPQLQT